MSKYQEYDGKNIDQALEKACKDLNLPLESLKYDVVSHGSTGIFGLVGVKKAKIRVLCDGKNNNSPNYEIEAKAQAKDLVKDAFQLSEPEEEEDVEERDEILTSPPEYLQNAASAGQKALQRMIEFISDGGTIHTEIQKERLLFKIEGGDSGILIGKRGQTLEALQYLLEKIINKQNEQRIRVLVDVEGYLDTRKSNLKKLASRMADKAQKINKPVTIGQMNAYDRRIVHLHLKDNQAVRTQSVGEGYYRKLIIFPKKKRRNRNMN